MASIRKEFSLSVSAERVWEVLSDFGAVHTRLAPGFVTDTKLDGNARIVTFANGSVAREELVTMDDGQRRLVYMIRSERLQHHNASAEIVPDGQGCRFVWTTDVLPLEIAPYIGGQMDAVWRQCGNPSKTEIRPRELLARCAAMNSNSCGPARSNVMLERSDDHRRASCIPRRSALPCFSHSPGRRLPRHHRRCAPGPRISRRTPYLHSFRLRATRNASPVPATLPLTARTFRKAADGPASA